MHILDSTLVVDTLQTDTIEAEILEGDLYVNYIYPYTGESTVSILGIVISSNTITTGTIDWSNVFNIPSAYPPSNHKHSGTDGDSINNIYYTVAEAQSKYLMIKNTSGVGINQTLTGVTTFNAGVAYAPSSISVEENIPVTLKNVTYPSSTEYRTSDDELHVRTIYSVITDLILYAADYATKGRCILQVPSSNTNKLTLTLSSAQHGDILKLVNLSNIPITIKCLNGSVIYYSGAGTTTIRVSKDHGLVTFLNVLDSNWFVDISRNSIPASIGYTSGNYSNPYLQYLDLTITSGGTTAAGMLLIPRGYPAGISGPQYGYIAGGQLSGNACNNLEYIDMKSIKTGSLACINNLATARFGACGLSGTTYGFVGGGSTNLGGPCLLSIEYFNLTSLSVYLNNKGDLTQARLKMSGLSGPTYGFFCGGDTSDDWTFVNTIDYINLTTTSGNASTRTGSGYVANGCTCGLSGANYGYIAGGNTTTIYYLDITTTSGNTASRGTLPSNSGYSPTGLSGPQYGYIVLHSCLIYYLDITTTSGNIDRSASGAVGIVSGQAGVQI